MNDPAKAYPEVKKNLIIRPFRHDDIDALAEIQKTTWQTFYEDILPAHSIKEITSGDLKEKWQQRVHYPMPPLDVAELDGTLIGSICYGPSLAHNMTSNTQLYSLFVHPDYYGKGVIGESLINHVKEWCDDSCEAIEGWLSPLSEYADQFLRNMGFEPTDQKRVVTQGGFPVEEVLYVLPLK